MAWERFECKLCIGRWPGVWIKPANMDSQSARDTFMCRGNCNRKWTDIFKAQGRTMPSLRGAHRQRASSVSVLLVIKDYSTINSHTARYSEFTVG